MDTKIKLNVMIHGKSYPFYIASNHQLGYAWEILMNCGQLQKVGDYLDLTSKWRAFVKSFFIATWAIWGSADPNIPGAIKGSRVSM